MPPAIIAAGVGAAASIGGGLLSASAQKKAAKQAAASQTQSDQATIGLARDLYGQNSANMRPFMQSGQRANSLLDSFLYGGSFRGLDGGQQGQPGGSPTPAMPGQNYSYGQSGGGSMAGPGGLEPHPTNNLTMDTDRMGPLYGENPLTSGGYSSGSQFTGMVPEQAGGQGFTGGAGATGGGGQNPWDVFRNSTNYQFRLGQGLDSVNQGYAGMGALQSGAALKGITEYGQNFASNEFNNYLGLLQGQQALGAGSASALAGVGNDYLGSVTAANRNSADAQSNAALLRGNANQNLYGGIAQGLGSLASSFKW